MHSNKNLKNIFQMAILDIQIELVKLSLFHHVSDKFKVTGICARVAINMFWIGLDFEALRLPT